MFVLSWSVVCTHQDQFEIHPNKERFKENWIVDQENVTSLIAKHCPSPRSPDFRPSWTVIGKEIILEKKVEKKNFLFKFSMSTINFLLSFTLIYPLLLSYSNCRFHYPNTIEIWDSLYFTICSILVFNFFFNQRTYPISKYQMHVTWCFKYLNRKW